MSRIAPYLPDHRSVVTIPRLEPSEAAWGAIGEVLGRPLSDVERQTLYDHADGFVFYTLLESASPTLKDAARRAAAIQKHAKALTELLTPRADTAALYVCDVMDDELQRGSSDWRYHKELEHARNLLVRIDIAMNRTHVHLKEAATKEAPNEAWYRLIFYLADLCEELGIKPTVRNDFAKQRNLEGKPTKFIEFVQVVMNLVPEEFRRGTFSAEALNGQVAKALRARKAVLKTHSPTNE